MTTSLQIEKISFILTLPVRKIGGEKNQSKPLMHYELKEVLLKGCEEENAKM